MNRQRLAASLAAVMAITAAAPMTAEASSSYSMRKKVITAAGIMTAQSDDSSLVTRAQFAKMLVNASTYRSSISAENNVSIFADVDRNNEYASYIRTAVEQGWMTGYLGGKFKPDENITMQEAVKAVLTLLGYTNEDFGNNQAANRLAKAAYLELDDEIGKSGTEVLSRFDCVNLFYNLMKTNTKENEGKKATSSTVYASVLDFTLTSDGEINPLEALESKLKGPIAVKDRSMSSILPFSVSKASFYLDGESATADEVEDEAIVIYYNTTSRAVYGYSESGNGGRGATEGTLDAIYYKSSDVMIPTSIVVSGTEYELTTSDMQFAFSVYGDLKIGDDIIVIWEDKSASADDDNDSPEYQLIDYIE
ncbi:S-layer homology domain-containing protein [uncultured Clostridium sp.]|uniref:S-layer homology domain-containing protein n=1 Tax=uncultured Clostridium sp. TaxID=59620 RepID=UPI0025FD55AA|nr:S-layer homology domain-containing protein [uncultured Clostridium sp.]